MKGSSFFAVVPARRAVPFLGLVVALLYRVETDELRRQCPGCGRVTKLHDAMCTRCGHELEFPDGRDRAGEPSAARALRRGTLGRLGRPRGAMPLPSHLGRRSNSRMRAVDAVMECLKAEGVDVVFGLPGGANLPTYDAFVDAGIRHILVRHEAGGGHAAEGYAKATGKVGVAFATSRPGRDEPRHADHATR